MYEQLLAALGHRQPPRHDEDRGTITFHGYPLDQDLAESQWYRLVFGDPYDGWDEECWEDMFSESSTPRHSGGTGIQREARLRVLNSPFYKKDQ